MFCIGAVGVAVALLLAGRRRQAAAVEAAPHLRRQAVRHRRRGWGRSGRARPVNIPSKATSVGSETVPRSLSRAMKLFTRSELEVELGRVLGRPR